MQGFDEIMSLIISSKPCMLSPLYKMGCTMEITRKPHNLIKASKLKYSGSARHTSCCAHGVLKIWICTWICTEDMYKMGCTMEITCKALMRL